MIIKFSLIIMLQLVEAPYVISLGPAGTILYTILAIILMLIVWRQRNWRTAAESATTAREAAISEMNVYKQSCDRLRNEMSELRDNNAKLKAMTDLQPLMTAQQTTIEIIKQWIIEGRERFDNARETLESNTKFLTALAEEIKAQRVMSEEAYKNLTDTFISHTLEDKKINLEHTQVQVRVAGVLSELERRMSIIAVQVGVITWENKQIDNS